MKKLPVLPLLLSLATGATGWSQEQPAPGTQTASVTVTAAQVPPVKIDPLQAQKDEVAKLTLEKDKLVVEMALAQAKLDKELSENKANVSKLQSQLAELKASQDLLDYQTKIAQEKEVAELKKTLERALLESNLAKAVSDKETMDLIHAQSASKREFTTLTTQMELELKQAESRTYATHDPVYLKEPLQGKKLVISDRRIPLNGIITNATADQITDKINYFNNRDKEMPIFLIIDDSPGGSVMAGYKILKAMQGSDAPVYVVVKSFAASMAACIATLAQKSYAYPNAVILHHQISAFSGGNLTQQHEWVKEMEEWWKRLADPIAQKMGITRDDFIKQMYAHTSTGDWNEFGDNAVKLKWVDNIVDEIQETSTVRLVDATPAGNPMRSPIPSPGHESLKEERDEKGRLSMTLPRLNPMDCYWIYNPDGFFRLP
jgi:ATP-dependent Clp protease protease subunit